GTVSKPRENVAGSPRWHSQLLPHESTFRSGGSHQRQHQNPLSKGPWLQESRLSAAQGSAHGGHQDRIHRSSESRLKCGSLRILVQSPKFSGLPMTCNSMAPTHPRTGSPGGAWSNGRKNVAQAG